MDNLALACFPCNRRKSDHQEMVDPETGASVRLFHPRQDQWGSTLSGPAIGFLFLAGQLEGEQLSRH